MPREAINKASARGKGGTALSPEMAIWIDKAFGPKIDTLLRMQTAYEIAEARDREGNIKVKRYVPKPTIPRDEAPPGIEPQWLPERGRLHHQATFSGVCTKDH